MEVVEGDSPQNASSTSRTDACIATDHTWTTVTQTEELSNLCKETKTGQSKRRDRSHEAVWTPLSVILAPLISICR